MKSRSALRLFIVLFWVLSLLAPAVQYALPDWPPPSLQAWEAEEATREIPLALLPTLLLIVVASVASSIALFRFRRWGTPVFLVSTLLGYVGAAVLGPQVSHGAVYVCSEAGTLSAGIVIGLCYWSDALEPRDQKILNS